MDEGGGSRGRNDGGGRGTLTTKRWLDGKDLRIVRQDLSLRTKRKEAEKR